MTHMKNRCGICAGMVVLITAALICGACATSGGAQAAKPSVQEQARASSGAPVSAQVDVVTFPFDPNLPKYVVEVEPFEYSASGQISGGGQAGPVAEGEAQGETITIISADQKQVTTRISAGMGPAIGKGLSAQLMTALSGWPNVSMTEPGTVTKNADGTYKCKMIAGEAGPFVLRGTVTEFSETADIGGKKSGFNPLAIGLTVLGAGALAHSHDAMVAGGAFAAVGPRFKNEKLNRTGMVGMDLRLVDGRTGRILSSYSCQGTFKTVGAGSNFSILGISSGKGETAASSLGNATRAAMNDALKKTHDALMTVR